MVEGPTQGKGNFINPDSIMLLGMKRTWGTCIQRASLTVLTCTWCTGCSATLANEVAIRILKTTHFG